MKKLFLVLAATLILSACGSENADSEPAENDNYIAVDVPLYDAREAAPASRTIAFPFNFTAEDLHGNTVIAESSGEYEAFFVYYWTTWCPSCVRSMPGLVSLAEEFAGRVGFLTLLGDFDTARETAIRITNDANVPFYTINAAHDELRPLMALLASGFVPTSVVIGADGSVIGEPIVGGNATMFRSAIENAIGG